MRDAEIAFYINPLTAGGRVFNAAKQGGPTL